LKKETTMRNLILLTLGIALVALVGSPQGLKAQSNDAISLTNQAILELTDFPATGLRYTVDPLKPGGADVRQMKKATALLQDALSKARSGGAGPAAIMKLEEAIAYGEGLMHKEQRLYAQGALYHLCKGQTGDPCDKAPKFGAYVAP
jgi:hypothetical protein